MPFASARPHARARSRAVLLTTVAALLIGLLPAPTARAGVTGVTELFFSEYIEGSSNNKALEIYNGTSGAIDLAAGGYNVQIFFNGSATAGLTINLTGTVAALTLTAPAGTVGTQRNVALSGPVSAVTLAAIAGTVATQQVVALTGAVAGLTLTAPAGTFSAQGANDGSPVRNPRAALTTPTSAATITGTVSQATLTTPTSRGTLT